MPKSKKKASKKKASKKKTAKKAERKEDSQKCVICEREMEADGYCKYHNRAYHNVMKAFDDWEVGYGELSFLEYLQKLIENPATGEWAKEVAEVLLKEEASKE